MEFNTGVTTVSFLFSTVFMTHIFFHCPLFLLSIHQFRRCKNFKNGDRQSRHNQRKNFKRIPLFLAYQRKWGREGESGHGDQMGRKSPGSKRTSLFPQRMWREETGANFQFDSSRPASGREADAEETSKTRAPPPSRQEKQDCLFLTYASWARVNQVTLERRKRELSTFPTSPLVHQPPTRTSAFFLYRPHCFVKWSQGERGKNYNSTSSVKSASPRVRDTSEEGGGAVWSVLSISQETQRTRAAATNSGRHPLTQPNKPTNHATSKVDCAARDTNRERYHGRLNLFVHHRSYTRVQQLSHSRH